MPRNARLEYQRQWREANREKVRGYRRAFYARNADAQKAKAKRERSSGKHQKIEAAYRSRNREELNRKSREYRQQNRDKVRAYGRARARKSHAALTKEQRDVLNTKARERYWRGRDAKNKVRRANYEPEHMDAYIPESTTRMELDSVMWIAKAEGRDPVEARRQFFSERKSWERVTKPLVTPYEDGPYYVPLRDMRASA